MVRVAVEAGIVRARLPKGGALYWQGGVQALEAVEFGTAEWA